MTNKIILSESLSQYLQTEYKLIKQVKSTFESLYENDYLNDCEVSRASQVVQNALKIRIANKIIEFVEIYNSEGKDETSFNGAEAVKLRKCD